MKKAFSKTGWAILLAACAVMFILLADVVQAQEDTGICDRTQAVQDAILSRLTDVSACGDVTAANLAGITGTFELSDMGVTSLNSGDFAGLSGLTKLVLSDTQVTTLPEEIFSGLTGIEWLELTFNKLTALPEDLFDGLTNLQVLHLYQNKITALPVDVFDGLDKLELLFLDDNEITTLPAAVFDGLGNLLTLSLGRNEITTLPADVFDGLDSLETLTLDKNQISALPTGMFEGLDGLTTVYLTRNPGTPFMVNAELEQRDTGVVVKVTEGAPFDMTVTLSADGGTLSTTTVTIEGGSTESAPIAVTPSGDGNVTVSVESAEFPGHVYGRGIQAGAGDSLTINRPATGAPSINGTAQVGETLTVSMSGIADEDGLTNVSYSYHWLADDSNIAGATDSTFTLVAPDEGKAIKVRVGFTDDADNDETLTSAATVAVAARPNNPATGAPTVSGTAQVGETLAVDTSAIADADGLDNVSYSYEWVAGDTDISDAMGSTYTLVEDDEGNAIQVRVSFTDDEGHAETLISAATAPVAARSNSPATGAPTISGTGQVGETLSASTLGIADADELTNVTYSYQWVRENGDNDADISTATAGTYTLVSADEGKAIKVRVSFADDRGNAETLTSAATAPVEPKPNSPATGQPTINGTAQVGETLTADTSDIADADELTNASYGYQWLAEGSDISGATGATYTLTSSELGQTVQVRVSFTDDRGNAETLTSTSTASVTAPPSPLTASLENAASSHDGQAAFTFELRFSENVRVSYRTLRDHAFTVSNGDVTRAKRLEQGSNVRWRITVEPDSNADVTIVLPVTTDCDATGAVCTHDGRMLSSRLELTVPGPNG